MNEFTTSNLPSWIKDGDILLIQKPFQDETLNDYTNIKNKYNNTNLNTLNNNNLNNNINNNINDIIDINHIALVTDINSSHCISHSTTEGYSFPSCRNTKLWNGIYIVIRLNTINNINNLNILNNTINTCKKWCSGVEIITKQDYLNLYNHYRWEFRIKNDLNRFKYTNIVASHPNIYNEPRATNDLRLIYNNESNISLISNKSIIRAIKFSTRRDLTIKVTKGFRCTPLIVTSFQSAILSPIVKSINNKNSFKSINCLNDLKELGKDDEYLIKEWENTKEGQLLLNENYIELFLDGAFSIDCRYCVPKDVCQRLIQSSQFTTIGIFSYFNKSIIEEYDFLNK